MNLHRCLLSVVSKNRFCLATSRLFYTSVNTNQLGGNVRSKYSETKVLFSNLNDKPILQTADQPSDQQQKQLEESELKDHISKLHDYLVSFAIPKFFAIRHPWAIYNKNIYFENRLWDEVETAKGLDAYAWKLMKFRFGAILSYARSKLEVVGSRVEGRDITIHWRFSGLPQSTVFFAFWRFKPWKLKQAKKENSRIIEAISTLSVGSDKLIYKHVIDRLVVDQNFEDSKSKATLLREKLQKVQEEKALT